MSLISASSAQANCGEHVVLRPDNWASRAAWARLVERGGGGGEQNPLRTTSDTLPVRCDQQLPDSPTPVPALPTVSGGGELRALAPSIFAGLENSPGRRIACMEVGGASEPDRPQIERPPRS